jgi:PleD family two-component response regulator
MTWLEDFCVSSGLSKQFTGQGFLMASSSASGRILALCGTNTQGTGWATAVLSWSGYTVDRATDAETALRMLQSAQYDLILLSYSSSPDDIQRSVDLVQDPDARLPTLFLLDDTHDFISPPQTHFVPHAILEPGFSSGELLLLVEKLRQYRL